MVQEDARGGVLVHEDAAGFGARKLAGLPTATLGREHELARLQGIFKEIAEDGAPRAALVTGPAGIGKSGVRAQLIQHLETAPRAPIIAALPRRRDEPGRGPHGAGPRPARAHGRPRRRAPRGPGAEGEAPTWRCAWPARSASSPASSGSSPACPSRTRTTSRCARPRESPQLVRIAHADGGGGVLPLQVRDHAADPGHRGHALGRQHHRPARRLAARLRRSPLRGVRLRAARALRPVPVAVGAPRRDPRDAPPAVPAGRGSARGGRPPRRPTRPRAGPSCSAPAATGSSWRSSSGPPRRAGTACRSACRPSVQVRVDRMSSGVRGRCAPPPSSARSSGRRASLRCSSAPWARSSPSWRRAR